jgi:hypothetical protein
LAGLAALENLGRRDHLQNFHDSLAGFTIRAIGSETILASYGRKFDQLGQRIVGYRESPYLVQTGFDQTFRSADLFTL